jgi:hypothetical protein
VQHALSVGQKTDRVLRIEPFRPESTLRARHSQQSRGSGAHEKTDEVRDESDCPDDTGIVVTRTLPKPLRSIAGRDRPDNDHHRENAPPANNDAEGQAEEKPGKPENDTQPDNAHAL